jgi:hypothetical protein
MAGTGSLGAVSLVGPAGERWQRGRSAVATQQQHRFAKQFRWDYMVGSTTRGGVLIGPSIGGRSGSGRTARINISCTCHSGCEVVHIYSMYALSTRRLVCEQTKRLNTWCVRCRCGT